MIKYIFLFTVTINHTIFNIRKNQEKIGTLFSKLDDISSIVESIFDVKFENGLKEEEYEKNIKELDERKNTMKKLLDKQLENSFKEASMLI